MVRLVLLRLLESYFRHRWLYLLPLVLMVAAGIAYFVYAPPTYIARGTMYVQKNALLSTLTDIRDTGYTWQSPAQTASKEVSELMQSEAFARAALEQTSWKPLLAQGPDAADEAYTAYRKAVWLEQMGDHMLRFSAKDRDPQSAQQLVDATIKTYTDWTSNTNKQESVVAQQFFANLLPSYQSAVDKARENMRTYLNDHPEPVRGDRPLAEQLEIQRLQGDIDTAQQRLLNAMDKEESARLAESKAQSDATNNYVVVDAPLVPAEPTLSLRSSVAYALLFVALGLLITIVGIVGGALLDRSFRFPLDVRHGVDLPVLAMVPFQREQSAPPDAAGVQRGHDEREQTGPRPLVDPSTISS